MDSAGHVGGHRRASRPRRLASRRFWVDALERALRAAAGGALAVFGAGEAALVVGVDWRLAAGAASAAAVVSLLVSIAAGGVGDPGSAGFAGGAVDRPEQRGAAAGEG